MSRENLKVFDRLFGPGAPLALPPAKEIEYCPQCGEGEIDKDGFCKECDYPADDFRHKMD